MGDFFYVEKNCSTFSDIKIMYCDNVQCFFKCIEVPTIFEARLRFSILNWIRWNSYFFVIANVWICQRGSTLLYFLISFIRFDFLISSIPFELNPVVSGRSVSTTHMRGRQHSNVWKHKKRLSHSQTKLEMESYVGNCKRLLLQSN